MNVVDSVANPFGGCGLAGGDQRRVHPARGDWISAPGRIGVDAGASLVDRASGRTVRDGTTGPPGRGAVLADVVCGGLHRDQARGARRRKAKVSVSTTKPGAARESSSDDGGESP